MALDFKQGRVQFDSTAGIIQTQTVTVVFPGRVSRADVALNGFDIRYDNGDHHLLRQMVDAQIDSINRNTVTVRVNFLLRDSSGQIDDRFSGRVDVLVIADVG